LALHGAHVVLACRNMRSAKNAINAIKREHAPADCEAMFVDLMSLKTVYNFACSYLSRNMYALQCHLFHVADELRAVLVHAIVWMCY